MVFVLIRAFGLELSNILLIITIYKLKSAKVEVKESGHLKLFDICILLVMQIATIIAGLVSFFFFNKTEKGMIYTDASRDVLEFFLAIFYFKVIIHFIKDFRLVTKVNKDGSIDIVALDETTGHELFKFNIDEEQSQCMLGIDQSIVNHHMHRSNSTRRRSLKESIQSKGTFEIIDDGEDSLNDFSDSDDQSNNNASDATSNKSSNFISAFDRGSDAGNNNHATGEFVAKFN